MTLPGPAVPTAKLRVLLVEDDVDHVFLIRRALRSVAGITVSTEVARTGEQAIEQLLRTRFVPGALPELVLLDLRMPRLDGLEVLRRLRADPTLQSLPVVVLTSSERDDDRDQALRLGAPPGTSANPWTAPASAPRSSSSPPAGPTTEPTTEPAPEPARPEGAARVGLGLVFPPIT